MVDKREEKSNQEEKDKFNTIHIYLFRRVEREILHACLLMRKKKDNIEIIFSHFVMVDDR